MQWHRAASNAWLVRALAYLNDLSASTHRPILLHGDLHHDNILRHQHAWVVIDPKGIIGDLHFDVMQYLLKNPGRGGDAMRVLRRPVATIEDRLSLEKERIAMWGIAKGLLDACWALRDGGDWRRGLHTAGRFERLRDQWGTGNAPRPVAHAPSVSAP